MLEWTEKCCSKCKTIKPIARFTTKPTSPDGHMTWCKDCQGAISKACHARIKAETLARAEPLPEEKICYKCEQIKPANAFPRASIGGLTIWCKACTKVYVAAKRYNKKASLGRLYGLTLEQYDQMYQDQQGLCKICECSPTGKQGLGVDHDHQTGKVRGLLCTGCNIKLARVEDGTSKNAEFLILAKIYLGNHQQKEAS